jgi:pyridoxal phosphate enzyme (YggS family)
MIKKKLMNISENIDLLTKELPAGVRVVAVSKMMPVEIIMEAYHAGQRLFGENKAQEIISKQSQMPEDICWHFIGHLQTNKVKFIIPFVEMIESVDSLKLLKEINKEAIKCNRVINCLLQFHIATEETKFGLDLEEAEALMEHPDYKDLKNVKICGVMGMASFSEDENLVRKEFRGLREVFLHLKEKYFDKDERFREISMGMTGDYRIAVEEGSTIIRIGTGIFGKL